MSTIVNRISGNGEFQIGQAKFVVLEVRGGMLAVVQTHSFADGSLLPEFQQVNNGGVFDFPDGFSRFAELNGLVHLIPQTHAALNAIKATIADYDNQNLELCPVCVGNSVDLGDMVGACDSCVANNSTIAYLKTV